MLEWTLPEGKYQGDTERMFFFIKKHFSKSLLFSLEMDEGGGAESSRGPLRNDLSLAVHHRAQLLRKAARDRVITVKTRKAL